MVAFLLLQKLILSSNSWTVLRVARLCWWHPLMNLQQSKCPLSRPIHFLTASQSPPSHRHTKQTCWLEYFTDPTNVATHQWQFFGATWDLTAVRKHWQRTQCQFWFRSSDMTCFNRLTDEAKKLISELGSKNVHSLAFRDNWLFVGGKDVTVKGDFEKVTVTLLRTSFTANWANSCYSNGQRYPQQTR